MNRYLKQALLWGLSGGFLCFVWFLIVYYSGANPFFSFSQKLVIIIQAAIAFFVIKDFKQKSSEKLFSFADGLLCGFSVMFVLSVFCGILVFIFTQYIHPEMVADHILELKKYLVTNKEVLIKGSSVEIYEGNLKNMDGVTAFTLGLDEFIWKNIRGAMPIILSSLVLRQSKES